MYLLIRFFLLFISITLINFFLTIAYLAAQPTDTLWIEKFENESSLKDWKPNKKPNRTSYQVEQETNNSFLNIRSNCDDNFILKKIKVDLVEFPFLNWSWRARELPKEGNEYFKKSADATGAIYVVLRASRWRPQSIKFTWSSTLEENSEGKSPFALWPSKSDFIVMESGLENKDVWVHEKVNVLECYKKLYHKSKVQSKLIEVIALMTDSDNTKSQANCDYDNVFFTTN